MRHERHSSKSTRVVSGVEESIASFVTSESGRIAKTLDRLRRFAEFSEPILLHGETGTGKTHFALWAHLKSRRDGGPFHRVNLAGLDDGIANSELFGHVLGAFTDARMSRSGAFATANHGTLFLDEIGKATTTVQRKLLDVMERGKIRPVGSDIEIPVDVRLIFAANEPLEELVASGGMLRDFLPRLGLFRVDVPPLRERREDIPTLIRFFVSRHAARLGWPADAPPCIAPSLDAALSHHDWPGNARELENLVRRLLVDGRESRELSAALLVGDLAGYNVRPVSADERRIQRAQSIREAVSRSGGNRSQAARQLGMSRSTLYEYERMNRSTEQRLSS